MKLVKDIKSKSLSYRLKPSIHQIDKKIILRKNKNNKAAISRICLNSSPNDNFFSNDNISNKKIQNRDQKKCK